MTRRLSALLLALVVVVVACGGRGDNGLTRAEQRRADSLAAGFEIGPGTPFDEAAAQCFAERLVVDFDADRLLALDLAGAHDAEAIIADLDEREADLFTAALLTCVDVTDAFADEPALDADDRDPDPGGGDGHPAGRRGTTYSLRVGHCFDDLDPGSMIHTIWVVPCSEPHDNEVYFRFRLPDGPFPGEDVAFRLAENGCFDEFEPFVGTDYWDSDLDFFAIYPSKATWNTGDRAVLCVLFAVDRSKLVGSMQDAAR